MRNPNKNKRTLIRGFLGLIRTFRRSLFNKRKDIEIFNRNGQPYLAIPLNIEYELEWELEVYNAK